MSGTYWDKTEAEFSSEYLNVHASDRDGQLLEALERRLKPNQRAADFGCGIGWGVPGLAERAARVYAIDCSERLLEKAKEELGSRYEQVQFVHSDLARQPPAIPRVHLGLCVNVLLSQHSETRAAILRHIAERLVRKGALLLVTPSLESQAWVHHYLLRQAQRAGPRAVREANQLIRGEARRMEEGLINLEGDITKYYLAPELQTELGEHGFRVVRCAPIEYDWDAEAITPESPSIPRPWHWFAVAEKL